MVRFGRRERCVICEFHKWNKLSVDIESARGAGQLQVAVARHVIFVGFK